VSENAPIGINVIAVVVDVLPVPRDEALSSLDPRHDRDSTELIVLSVVVHASPFLAARKG
jgi:hypothetical protein